MADDRTVVKGFMSFKDDVPPKSIPDRIDDAVGGMAALAIALLGTTLRSLDHPQRRELVNQLRATHDSLEDQVKQTKGSNHVKFLAYKRELERFIKALEKSIPEESAEP